MDSLDFGWCEVDVVWRGVYDEVERSMYIHTCIVNEREKRERRGAGVWGDKKHGFVNLHWLNLTTKKCK